MAKRLRFGVTDATGKVSPYITVTTSSRGDIYAACHAMPETFHISLHESRYHWHVTINTPQGKRRMPIRAHDVDPYTTCAVTLNIPPTSAVLAKSGKDVKWIQTDKASEWPAVAFRFLVQLPDEGGAFLDARWAEKAGVMTLVGRLPLADFGTLTVTAAPREMPPPTLFEVTIDGEPGEARSAMADDFAGDSFFLLAGDMEDGGTELFLVTGSSFRLLG